MQDRESIELALQRVKSGEGSAAATQWLLSGKPVADATTHCEPLASLVDRLGTPPKDIMEAWCHQLRGIARLLEHETGGSLPAIDPTEWSITPRGRLAWNDRLPSTMDDGKHLSPTSLERIDRFRATWDGAGVERTSFLTRSEPGGRTSSPPQDPQGHHDQKRKPNRIAGNPTRLVRYLRVPPIRQFLFTTAIVACLAAGGWILYRSTGLHQETAGDHHQPSARLSQESSRISGLERKNRTKAIDSVTADFDALDSRTLQSLESLTEAELSALEKRIETSDPLSLDTLLPATRLTPAFSASATSIDTPPASGDLAGSELRPAGEAAPTPGADQHALGSDSFEKLPTEMATDDTTPPESPQQTQASSVMSVQLAAIDELNQATLLVDHALSGVTLDFPYDLPLRIKGQASPWEIVDQRKQITVAVITSRQGGAELRWTEDAQGSAAAAALAHGRLTTPSGTIYLRPTIESTPWPIRVDKPDVMPTWDLRQPIPTRAARLSIGFGLPAEIEAGWIEPLEPESIRRSRGFAVLTPQDDRSVALGIRFDVRCSRKLSCRVRYAGRLDASMPWQLVSVPLLEQYASQLTQQAILISEEANRLDSVYEIAGASGRRILRVKQRRNDALAERIRLISQRVARLQSLIAELETDGTLKVRVWVEWPDTQQELLTTVAIDRLTDTTAPK